MVEAQNARMCGFCWTVPHTRSKGSSVALLFSSTANLKSDMANAARRFSAISLELLLSNVSLQEQTTKRCISRPIALVNSNRVPSSVCVCVIMKCGNEIANAWSFHDSFMFSLCNVYIVILSCSSLYTTSATSTYGFTSSRSCHPPAQCWTLFARCIEVLRFRAKTVVASTHLNDQMALI